MSDAKKLAAYEAVLALISEGVPPAEIKVADVAARAGIGKGTVYEFTDSKEQLIADAMLYAMGQALSQFEERLAKHTDYHAKLHAMVRLILEFVQHNIPLAQQLLMAGNTCGLQFETLRRDTALSAGYERLVDNIVAMGLAEGKLTRRQHPFIQRSAAYGIAVQCILFTMDRDVLYASLSEDEVVAMVCEIFQKTIT